jgi:hypothetical protein
VKGLHSVIFHTPNWNLDPRTHDINRRPHARSALFNPQPDPDTPRQAWSSVQQSQAGTGCFPPAKSLLVEHPQVAQSSCAEGPVEVFNPLRKAWPKGAATCDRRWLLVGWQLRSSPYPDNEGVQGPTATVSGIVQGRAQRLEKLRFERKFV